MPRNKTDRVDRSSAWRLGSVVSVATFSSFGILIMRRRLMVYVEPTACLTYRLDRLIHTGAFR
jgi:hypothetical protein